MSKTDSTIEELVKDAAPVKRLHSPLVRVSVWLGLAVLVIFVILPVIGMRPNMAEKASSPIFIAEMVAILVAGFCAILAAVSLSVPDTRPRTTEYILITIALSVWIVLAVLSVLYSTHEEMWAELQRVKPGLWCTRNVIMIGFIPAVIILYMIRRTAPTRSRMTSFLAVLGAFSFGVLGCRLHYGDVPMYVLIWQYSPAIIAALLAMVVSEKLLKW